MRKLKAEKELRKENKKMILKMVCTKLGKLDAGFEEKCATCANWGVTESIPGGVEMQM